MFTWQENVRVMVVNTCTISRDTADEVLDKAVQYAAVAGERDKTRMVCAILHKKHYDIGVLHTAEGIQAVFQVGEEWDNAIRLILRFIKAKLLPTGQAQCLICPRWKERKQESEVKVRVDFSGVRTRSTRAQVIARELEGGKANTWRVAFHAAQHAVIITLISTKHTREHVLLSISNTL